MYVSGLFARVDPDPLTQPGLPGVLVPFIAVCLELPLMFSATSRGGPP